MSGCDYILDEDDAIYLFNKDDKSHPPSKYVLKISEKHFKACGLVPLSLVYIKRTLTKYILSFALLSG